MALRVRIPIINTVKSSLFYKNVEKKGRGILSCDHLGNFVIYVNFRSTQVSERPISVFVQGTLSDESPSKLIEESVQDSLRDEILVIWEEEEEGVVS